MVRLKPLGSDSLFAIGGGEDCAAAFGISYSVGPGWERLDGELAGSWYFDPANRHTVRGPAGEAARCATDIVDLAGLDGAATGCAPVVGTATGEVALSISGSVVWLWTADQVLVSGDAGATW